jgi:hypothetical protein
MTIERTRGSPGARARARKSATQVKTVAVAVGRLSVWIGVSDFPSDASFSLVFPTFLSLFSF